MEYSLGCLPSPYDGRDLVVEPLIIDLKKKDVPFIEYEMTPVKSQGKRGSCTAYGGVAIKEQQEVIEHNLTTAIDLSEEHLYSEARKLYWGKDWQKHEGADGRSIAKVLSTIGVCEESYWEYGDREGATNPKEGYLVNAKAYLIDKNYVRVTSEVQIAPTLYKYGPLTLSVQVYENWLNVKEDGIIPDRPWWSWKKPLGGHLIAISGWNPKTKQYKVKNSWGIKWGQAGYGYISDKEVAKTIFDSFAFIDVPDSKKLRLADYDKN